MKDNRKTGLLAEVYASRFLRQQGYTINTANYHSNTGEIDIIANKDKVCIFFEVKARSADALFAPSDAVDIKKQERIKNTAAAYMAAEQIKNDFRFDIIEVVFNGDDYKINHIQNAF